MSEKSDILIVDDRIENLVALESLLENPDRNIIKATSGNEALELVVEHDFALILLDVQMPGMDGFETAGLLKSIEKTRHIPIIFVTAISREDKHVFKGYEVGAVDYLFKPIEPEILKSKVRVFLELDRKTSELRQAIETIHAQHKELEKAHADLKMTQSNMLQSEKMASIGQLAAGVAHEINNPMGFIISNLASLRKYANRTFTFIDSLEDAIKQAALQGNENCGLLLRKADELKKSLKIDYIKDDCVSLIEESLEGAERVKKIVLNLKSFSHIDESEYRLADINEGLKSTLKIVWNELKYKAVVNQEYGEIPLTNCNSGQLNQVFMNMLINAAHSIDQQGEITINTWHARNSIFISISDTGSGIPADKIDRIFEPFFTTKEVGKGTGLGLSIAYDIIKKHNGEIQVESAAGSGTAFILRIPVVGQEDS